MKSGHPERGKSSYARRQKTPYRYSDFCQQLSTAWKAKSPLSTGEVTELKRKHRAMMEREAPLDPRTRLEVPEDFDVSAFPLHS